MYCLIKPLHGKINFMWASWCVFNIGKVKFCFFSGYGFTKNEEGQPIEEVYNIGQYEKRNVEKSDVSCIAEYISRYTQTSFHFQ